LIRWPAADWGGLEQSHLFSRGWVFQEMLLSRRKLHFAEDQVYWHFRCLVKSEDGYYINHEEELLPSQVMKYVDWQDLMFVYSGKDFTFSTDRLAALAGVVKWYSKKYDVTPLLGLWHETLSLDLAWQRVGIYGDGGAPQKSTIAGIPSWTWLFWDDLVQIPLHASKGIYVPYLRVIDCSINWVGEPMTSALKNVDIRVQAPIKTLTLTLPQEEGIGLRMNGLEESEVILDELGWSSIPHRHSFQSETMDVLLLARIRLNHQDAKSVVNFLVMQEMPGTTAFPRYKRIGVGEMEFVDFPDDDLAQLPSIFSGSVERIVDLV
jgi:hypothetical protein